MMENGIRKMAANHGTVKSTTIKPAILPKYMLAIKPHTKSFCSTNKSGPGGKAPTDPTTAAFATYYGGYHGTYEPPFCAAQAKAFFDTVK